MDTILPEREPIEVTPEMIEAGLEVVWRTDITTPREDELRHMVRSVFLEMSKASPKCRREAF